MQYYLSPVDQLAVWQGLVEFAVRTGTVHVGQNRDVWLTSNGVGARAMRARRRMVNVKRLGFRGSGLPSACSRAESKATLRCQC